MSTSRPVRVYLGIGLAQGALWGAWWLGAVGLWVSDLDLSPLRLVVLGTALELAVLSSESLTGAVADTFSRRWSVVVSWLILTVAMVGSALSSDLIVLLGWQLLWGFGYTFQTGADTAWVTDEIGYEDDHLVMRHAIATNVGTIVGLVAGLASLAWLGVGVRAVMTVSGLGCLVVAGVLARVMTEENFTPARARGGADADGGAFKGGAAAVVATWRQGWEVVRSSSVLVVILVSVVLVAMADEAIDRLDVVRMVELGLPARDGVETSLWGGGLWLAMTVLRLPVMVATARRFTAEDPALDGPEPGDPELEDPALDRAERRLATTAVVALTLATMGVAVMGGSILAVALVGWFARDIVREVLEPVMTAWVNRHATSEVRATVISFRSQAMALGQVIGGLALGTLAEITMVKYAFYGAAVLLAGATLLLGRQRRSAG